MTRRESRPAEPLAERLLRLDLGDAGRVTLAIALYAAGVRLLALVLGWTIGLTWLVIQNALGILLYLFLIRIRRLPGRRQLIVFAYGPEWVLWSVSHTVAFGIGGSFQLYPLLLMPIFVLLLHGLEPRQRLVLMTAPLLLYPPILAILWRGAAQVDLPLEVQWRVAVANEVVVAATVVLVAGAALLEHVRARRLAEEREAAQAQLVEDLSHELRTPLATLLTAAQVAKASRDPERVAESLDWIEGAARSAGRLVERLLDLAALDRGRIPPGRPAELSRVVRGAVERLRPLAEPRDVVVELREASFCREAVDEVSLEIVVRSLVANAIAHSPAGERVEVRVLLESGRPRIEIEDRGEGIAPEHLPRIFDRLWRADPARSRSEGRYGLGLSIARRHADLIGARLEVRSELGRGSTFALSFDRAPSAT